MKHLILTFLIGILMIAAPLECRGDNSGDTSGEIALLPKKGKGKTIPFKFPTFLSFSGYDVCLLTSYPYDVAEISISDNDGNTYGSVFVTAENKCGYLYVEPNSTITVTFDTGLTLYGEN